MLGEIRGEVRFKEPLSLHTSLRIGGPADIFVVPQDVEDIRHALMFADREQLPVAVVGGGNNLVVRDRGIRGVVLKLEGCLGRAEYYGEEALAGAGVSLSALIREAAALNLGGIECLVGIPATIGGALAMNAGTADGWIGDFVSAVYYLHPDGALGEFKPSRASASTATSGSPSRPRSASSVSRGLLSPRGGAGALADLFGRTPLVDGQRVGPGRRRARRARALARLARRAVVLGVVLAGVAAALAGARWATTSPRFAIAGVEVHGASRVPVPRILAAAAIVPGTNLWTLDGGAVAARVSALPEIRRADLVRELPNRVTIVVEERRPFTLVHAGRLHWMDEEGRVLSEERRAVVPGVPVISGLTEEELVSMRTSPGPKARAAVALIRALLRSGNALAAEISEIDMSRPEGPVLYTVDGVEVRLGAEDWDERLARLEGVLAQVATQDVSGVDLRFKDQVVLRRGAVR